MSDKINYKSFAIGALAAIGSLSYLRPDAAISPDGKVNWQNILTIGTAGGALSYIIADSIEDASPVEKAKNIAMYPINWSKRRYNSVANVVGTGVDIVKGDSIYNNALEMNFAGTPILGRVFRWVNR